MLRQFGPNYCFNSLILKEIMIQLFNDNYIFPNDCINIINNYYLELRYGHLLLSCGDYYSFVNTNHGLFQISNNPYYKTIIGDNREKINIDNVLSVSTTRQCNITLILTTYGLYLYKNTILYSLDIPNVKSVSNGYTFMMILTSNGLYHCEFTEGPSVQDLGLTKIKIENVYSVKCGKNHSIIHTKDGLFGCGDTSYGQLGFVNYGDHDNNYYIKPQKINVNNDIIDYSCGANHNLALCIDGLYGWGNNCSGQRGMQQSPYEVHKINIDNVIAVYSGGNHNIILCHDGIYGFGDNSHGQLGIGNFENCCIPYKINIDVNVNKILSISCSFYHTIILTNEECYRFGYNKADQLDENKSIYNLPNKLCLNKKANTYFDDCKNWLSSLL